MHTEKPFLLDSLEFGIQFIPEYRFFASSPNNGNLFMTENLFHLCEQIKHLLKLAKYLNRFCFNTFDTAMCKYFVESSSNRFRIWTKCENPLKTTERILWDDRKLKCVIIGLLDNLHWMSIFFLCEKRKKKTMKNQLNPIDILICSILNETMMLHQNDNWFRWTVQSDAIYIRTIQFDWNADADNVVSIQSVWIKWFTLL